MVWHSSTTLCIALLGPPNSGKSCLAAKLHERVIRGRKSSFKINVQVTSQVEGLEDFHFVIVVLDLQDYEQSGLQHTIELIQKLASAARDENPLFNSPRKICVVGTKADLVVRDYSDRDISIRKLHVHFPYYQLVHYFETSARQDTGIHHLLRYISTQCDLEAKQPSWSIKSVASSLLDVALDSFAALFSLPVPKNTNIDTPDPIQLDDLAIDNLLKAPEVLAWDNHIAQFSCATNDPSSPTHKITNQLLAKDRSPSSDSEVAAMIYVRRHTLIPVPQPRYPGVSRYVIMDCIKGKMLLECWDSLGWFKQFRIACTLRHYVSQLRRAPVVGDRPGSIDTGITSGHLFDEMGLEFGPFENTERFRIWSEMVAVSGWQTAIRYWRTLEEPLPPQAAFPVLGGPWNLVFTHSDLSLSNLILSDDGVLWVVDWATAGFFPSWFETVGMEFYDNDHPIAKKSWSCWRWFIAGLHPQYIHLWKWVKSDIHRFHQLR